MNFYKLYNHNSLKALQGSMLEFCATNDTHAIELGKGYAEKLGWSGYTIAEYYGDDDERAFYSC